MQTRHVLDQPRALARIIVFALSTLAAACAMDDTTPAINVTGASGAGGAGGQSGAGMAGAATSAGGPSGTAGMGGAGGSGGTAGIGGGGAGGQGTGGASSVPDASTEASHDASTESTPSFDATTDAPPLADVINGTPDGGAYNRTGWMAVSVPVFPTGTKAQNNDLKYGNAFDNNFQTRWSIGDTNSPAQTIGDQFTFDMQALHSFRKILFWSGGQNGVGGPDSRDYPGALDVSVSTDANCLTGGTFGATLGSGMEPQPGCGGNASCNLPFVITLPEPATARCVRLTLTKRLQLGGGIWWAITELFVYP